MNKIEEEDRNRIKTIKEDEKKKADDDIEQFKKAHKQILDNEVFVRNLFYNKSSL